MLIQCGAGLVALSGLLHYHVADRGVDKASRKERL